MAGIERAQLDELGGLPAQLLGHHLALDGLDYDAVATPDRGARRDDDNVTITVERQHGIARYLQGIAVLVGDRWEVDLVPAAAHGKTAIVEIAALACLGEADQRQWPA